MNCMHLHADLLAAQPLAHSHCRLCSRHFVHCFFTLIYTSGRVDHTKHVVACTQHAVGCIAVPLFCKISVPTWTRLHVFKLLLLSCEYLHLLSACPAPKPNLSSALLRSASTSLSTCSLRLNHSFLVTPGFASKYLLYLQASSSNNTQTGKRKDRNRQGRHAKTHAD